MESSGRQLLPGGVLHFVLGRDGEGFFNHHPMRYAKDVVGDREVFDGKSAATAECGEPARAAQRDRFWSPARREKEISKEADIRGCYLDTTKWMSEVETLEKERTGLLTNEGDPVLIGNRVNRGKEQGIRLVRSAHVNTDCDCM